MNAMDELFDLYNEYFDRLEESGRRLNQLYPEPSNFPLKRMTRERFEQFLDNGNDNPSKRLFLKRILNGRDDLLPTLPQRVRELAQRAA